MLCSHSVVGGKLFPLQGEMRIILLRTSDLCPQHKTTQPLTGTRCKLGELGLWPARLGRQLICSSSPVIGQFVISFGCPPSQKYSILRQYIISDMVYYQYKSYTLSMFTYNKCWFKRISNIVPLYFMNSIYKQYTQYRYKINFILVYYGKYINDIRKLFQSI